jgi:hypothetical protein
MTKLQQYLSSGAKKDLFLSSGANIIYHQKLIHMYEPKGPYLRELAAPNKFLRVSESSAK